MNSILVQENDFNAWKSGDAFKEAHGGGTIGGIAAMLLATAMNTKGKPKAAMWEAILPVTVPPAAATAAESGWREVVADGKATLDGEAFIAMNRFSVLVRLVACSHHCAALPSHSVRFPPVTARPFGMHPPLLRLLSHAPLRRPACSQGWKPPSSLASRLATQPSLSSTGSRASSFSGATLRILTASPTPLGPSGETAPPSTHGAEPRTGRENPSLRRQRASQLARHPAEEASPASPLALLYRRFMRGYWCWSRRRASERLAALACPPVAAGGRGVSPAPRRFHPPCSAQALASISELGAAHGATQQRLGGLGLGHGAGAPSTTYHVQLPWSNCNCNCNM